MMRLDRLLASLALGSRQQVKALVRQGRVTVAGQPALDAGMQVLPGTAVCLDGETLDTRLKRHVMMNKPAGVLTAARDPRQPTVMDLLPDVYRSLNCMPVGRLDKDTEGLLLFTTDGQVAHRLLSPRRAVDKVYRAQVSGMLDEQAQQRFQQGIAFKDFTTLPARLDILSADEHGSVAEVTLQEGKFHQVRRMFAACGHEVLHLKRLRFGPVNLDPNLKPGDWRELTDTEWQALTVEGASDA